MNRFADFDTMPIPAGGSVPFHDAPRFDPPKPDVNNFNSKSKSRVNRNSNASSLEALYLRYETINQNQYEAGCTYRQLHRCLEPSMTASYGDVSGGSGRNGVLDAMDSYVDAETRCVRLRGLMEQKHFAPCEMLVIHDMPLSEIAAKMGRGWSQNMRKARIQECLEELSRALPKTKYVKELAA